MLVYRLDFQELIFSQNISVDRYTSNHCESLELKHNRRRNPGLHYSVD